MLLTHKEEACMDSVDERKIECMFGSLKEWTLMVVQVG